MSATTRKQKMQDLSICCEDQRKTIHGLARENDRLNNLYAEANARASLYESLYAAETATVSRLRDGLDTIYCIAADRDGFATAESLGELVDELYAIARNILNGKPPLPVE